VKLVILGFFVINIAFLGCARDNAVAMNLYHPESNDYEKASGITAVITQDMIDRVKK